VTACWADVPGLSSRVGSWPRAWQQYWQQPRGRCTTPNLPLSGLAIPRSPATLSCDVMLWGADVGVDCRCCCHRCCQHLVPTAQTVFVGSAICSPRSAGWSACPGVTAARYKVKPH